VCVDCQQVRLMAQPGTLCGRIFFHMYAVLHNSRYNSRNKLTGMLHQAGNAAHLAAAPVGQGVIHSIAQHTGEPQVHRHAVWAAVCVPVHAQQLGVRRCMELFQGSQTFECSRMQGDLAPPTSGCRGPSGAWATTWTCHSGPASPPSQPAPCMRTRAAVNSAPVQLFAEHTVQLFAVYTSQRQVQGRHRWTITACIGQHCNPHLVLLTVKLNLVQT
jgi:hypothetical protein